MIEMWATAPQDLQLLKLNIIEATGLGKDALHVYAGLTVFVVVRLIWRRRGGWWLAWVAALLLATMVEWLDLRAEASQTGPQPDGAHWHDIWNTMFWPTMLLLFGRWLRPNATTDPDLGELADEHFEQPPPI